MDNLYENKGKLDKQAVGSEFRDWERLYMAQVIEAEKLYSSRLAALLERLIEEP